MYNEWRKIKVIGNYVELDTFFTIIVDLYFYSVVFQSHSHYFSHLYNNHDLSDELENNDQNRK